MRPAKIVPNTKKVQLPTTPFNVRPSEIYQTILTVPRQSPLTLMWTLSTSENVVLFRVVHVSAHRDGKFAVRCTNDRGQSVGVLRNQKKTIKGTTLASRAPLCESSCGTTLASRAPLCECPVTAATAASHIAGCAHYRTPKPIPYSTWLWLVDGSRDQGSIQL